MDIDLLFVVLGIAAFFAGFVDAIVGGGGLIQIPALFAAYPNTTPATLFATNKAASIVGTSSAAIQYARRVRIPWHAALPGAVAALIGAWFGAKAVAYLPPDVLRPLILLLLIAVAVYTFMRKDLGQQSNESAPGMKVSGIAAGIGLVVGFYDGFFGPGTGSFLIFLFIRMLGMDFLRASVTAKILNVATNLAALAFFSLNVEVLWKLAALMALCNLAGAVTGSRMALRHGTAFVRKMFLFVVSVLIIKLTYDLLA
ncbi:sulfite exporter TauE/SafE family protein [Pseudothauera nasutitermitis]|uniref:Probable membrane transporter protein n=1 Tax=Pseudothauera nasutitermitis TaxID=2565930 RepID=A0A4S4AWR3_9RHOO|nr:TSUP family transporter [Pseudothauera nasutitermitis]THF64487.1 sulfite exporter TauE/SafE family protein [Pseudothauera nasutitermitis]